MCGHIFHDTKLLKL